MRPPLSRWRPAAVALLGLALALSACDADATLAGAVREPPLAVGAVGLPNVADNGTTETFAAPADELLLVYFGYTSCPDVCPTTLSDISVALGDLPPEMAERVNVAMVTVDPERDTDERLTGYLAHFFERSLAMRTTDPAALEAAADAFGVQFEVEDHEPGAPAYDVAHTAITYVVDETGTVVVEWPFGLEAEAMASDLEILLTRERT